MYHNLFTGQPIDSPVNGPPPLPWNIPVQPQQMFSDSQTKVEVPHTANIKVCYKNLEDVTGSLISALNMNFKNSRYLSHFFFGLFRKFLKYYNLLFLDKLKHLISAAQIYFDPRF